MSGIRATASDMIRRILVRRYKRSGVVLFSDTTLRDGEQMAGATLDPQAKLQIALALEKAGLHSIEAGFPASSRQEIAAIQLIAQHVRRPVLTALCRTLQHDVDCAAEALAGVPPHKRGVSLFCGTSPVHRRDKLGKSQSEILDLIGSSVAYAREKFDIVSFSPEDASRTEPEFLDACFAEAISAGASTIGFADTVGVLTPQTTTATLKRVQDQVPGIEHVLIAVHFHNDLGLAVANSLAAIEVGATVVQGTINGIGERAGNTPLEEVAVALHVNADQFAVRHQLKLEHLYDLSRLVGQLTGIPLSPCKPVVGDNIFLTEAGIHQAGLLKNPDTYLPFRPELIGAPEFRLVIGRHSGRQAIAHRLTALGRTPDDAQISNVLQRIKQQPADARIDDQLLLSFLDEVGDDDLDDDVASSQAVDSAPTPDLRLPHYLLGGSFRNTLRMLGRSADRARGHRIPAAKILAVNAVSAPCRWIEKLVYGSRVRNQHLHSEPVFLIGHWQSGHSLVHALLACDDQFGTLRVAQSVFPDGSILCGKSIASWTSKRLKGRDRGSDSLSLTPDLAQGSELPMALTGSDSFYHAYVFPNQAREIFRRSVLFDGRPIDEIDRWKTRYRLQMKKTALLSKRSRIVVRNAADTARIPHLLAMFPTAKFVFACRHPMQMIAATLERWNRMRHHWALQDFPSHQSFDWVLETCEQLFQRFERDRNLIPSGQLHFVKYEQLSNNPLAAMNTIYDELNLPGFETARPAMADWLEREPGGLGGSGVKLSPQQQSQVRKRLGFVFASTGYDLDE